MHSKHIVHTLQAVVILVVAGGLVFFQELFVDKKKAGSAPSSTAVAPAKVLRGSTGKGSKKKSTQKPLALRLLTSESGQTPNLYTLYATSGTEEVLLLNNTGEVVHRWAVDADRARLLPNCNLLVIHGSKWGLNKEPWKKLRPVVREYSWDGEVAWEATAPDIVHHDLQRTDSGSTFFLYRNYVPYKVLDGKKAGKPRLYRSDSVREVGADGAVLWEWHAHEHLDMDSCGWRGCHYDVGSSGSSKAKDWTHMNTVSVVPENPFWPGDKRFKPGNVFVQPRNWSTSFLVDRETKKVVWEYTGEDHGGLIGGHEVHMIPDGLPGAGHVLVFDNGSSAKRPYSIVLEINPIDLSVVWKYEDRSNFFSRVGGSMQRLPNGNTFISEDATGRIFEVTPDGQLVWEVKGNYRVNRAHRYDRGYCPELAAEH